MWFSNNRSFGIWGIRLRYCMCRVSALTINTVNSIKCFSSDIFNLEYEDEGGLMILTMDKESRDYPSAETLLLLQSLELGLKNIQKDYNNNISISYKEV